MRPFVRALVCASLMFAAFGAPAAAQTPMLPILDHIHLNGVKITTEPRPLRLASGTTVSFSYLEGPVGAKIEMVQR